MPAKAGSTDLPAGSNNYIRNTTTQQTADFNISGTGQATKFRVNPSGSYVPFDLFNNSANTSDALAFLYPVGTDKTMNIYASPSGDGAGGNQSSLTMFNSDYIANSTDFGFASFQIKSSVANLYTYKVGSASLVPLKLFTGTSNQLTLNTNGTSSFSGNVYADEQIGIQSTSPFSKALLHADRNVNDATYIMTSNINSGAAASTGFKATLNNTTDTSHYITLMALGPNYSAASRPTVGGNSSLVESTTGGHMYINNLTDTGSIVFTTKKTMAERARIDSTGKFSIEQMDSTASPANMVWRDPNTHKLKLAAVPTGGSSDLTGGAIKANVHIVNDADYTVSSTDYIIIYTAITATRTLTIPAASSAPNRMLIIRNPGGGSFSVTLSQTYRTHSSSTSNTVPVANSVSLISDGTEWWVWNAE